MPVRVLSKGVVGLGTNCHASRFAKVDLKCSKTTTMLFKMLGIENSWQQNPELRSERPRQLFVTQSRMLADKVEEYFIKLLQSLVLPSQTKGDISDLLERHKNREEAGLIDQDEAMNWREDLPQRFSELQDSHFPMFITFDKVRQTSILTISCVDIISSAVCYDRSGHEPPFGYRR